MNTAPIVGATDLWTMAIIGGLACITVIARGFFLLSSKPWSLPSWAQRALRYAPIAALSAVVVPEILVSQGHMVATWQDARIYASLAGAAAFVWRREVLATMAVGMAVYLPLHLGLGW